MRAFSVLAWVFLSLAVTACDLNSNPTPHASSSPSPTPSPSPSQSTSSISSQNSVCGGSSGTYWVFQNGVLNWPGDYSYGVTENYKDTSGSPLSGPYDLMVTDIDKWGGWQPYSANPFDGTIWNFPVTGCNYLTYALKPIIAHQTWGSYFMYVGDHPTNVTVDVTSGAYGPSDPPVGEWSVYKVPLKDYFPNGEVPSSIYKFAIQDRAGINQNSWYIDNVGFTAR